MPIRVIGSPWNDVLHGSDAFEAFYGLDGDDTIIASYGADVIDGGAGSDTIDYSAYQGGVKVWLDGARQVSAKGSLGEVQTLSSIENLILGAGNDVIHGDGSDNSFWGNGGNDTFVCSSGIDYYNGGSGFDTVDYTQAGIAIKVTFSSAKAASISTGGVVSDKLVSIEKIIGSAFGDTFQGSSADNTFFGGAGNDRFYASAGKDTYNGGSGTDTVDFGKVGIGLTIKQTGSDTATLSAAGVVSDKLISIENIIGSGCNDTIDGSASKNTLDGSLGNDRLDGKGGADTLIGGRGNDILKGGACSDTFVFKDGDGCDVITDFKAKGADADMIDLRGILTFDSYQGMLQHHGVYQSGHDVILDFVKGDQITLKDVWISDLSASDFLF